MWSDDLTYEVKVAPGVVFFATINEGDDCYGVNLLDAALKDRFPRVGDQAAMARLYPMTM